MGTFRHKYTEEECLKWKQNPTINPKSKRKIAINGPTYKRYEKEYNLYMSIKSDTNDIKFSKEILELWSMNKNINPLSRRRIKPSGKIYKMYEKEWDKYCKWVNTAIDWGDILKQDNVKLFSSKIDSLKNVFNYNITFEKAFSNNSVKILEFLVKKFKKLNFTTYMKVYREYLFTSITNKCMLKFVLKHKPKYYKIEEYIAVEIIKHYKDDRDMLKYVIVHGVDPNTNIGNIKDEDLDIIDMLADALNISFIIPSQKTCLLDEYILDKDMRNFLV